MELNVTTTLEGKRWNAREIHSSGISRQTQNIRVYSIRPLWQGGYNPNIKYMANEFKNPNVIAGTASLGKFISKEETFRVHSVQNVSVTWVTDVKSQKK